MSGGHDEGPGRQQDGGVGVELVQAMGHPTQPRELPRQADGRFGEGIDRDHQHPAQHHHRPDHEKAPVDVEAEHPHQGQQQQAQGDPSPVRR